MFRPRKVELVWLLHHLCEIVWGVFISFILRLREHINMVGVCGLCPHLLFYECASIHKDLRIAV